MFFSAQVVMGSVKYVKKPVKTQKEPSNCQKTCEVVKMTLTHGIKRVPVCKYSQIPPSTAQVTLLQPKAVNPTFIKNSSNNWYGYKLNISVPAPKSNTSQRTTTTVTSPLSIDRDEAWLPPRLEEKDRPGHFILGTRGGNKSDVVYGQSSPPRVHPWRGWRRPAGSHHHFWRTYGCCGHNYGLFPALELRDYSNDPFRHP